MTAKAKPTGLGRGLDALFSTSQPIDDVPVQEGKEYVVPVKISLIDVNKNQPRKNFDQKALEELAESIRANGLLQPIVLIRKGERYEIVAGERRFRAFRILGESTIPAIVKNLTNRQAMELALVENLQREDLSPIEEAKAINLLIEKFSLTQQELAQRIGKSRPAIANALRLITLPEEIQKLIDEGRISAGHGRAILSLEKEEDRRKLTDIIIKNNLSVRQAEALAAAMAKEGEAKPKKEKKKDAEIIGLEAQLRQVLGTKASIVGSAKKGKIEIEYYSQEDLERILEVIL